MEVKNYQICMYNIALREMLLEYLKTHFVCLSDTHLENDETITADIYVFIQHNRYYKYKQACTKTHGETKFGFSGFKSETYAFLVRYLLLSAIVLNFESKCSGAMAFLAS